MVDFDLNEIDAVNIYFKEKLKIYGFICKLFLKSRKNRL